MKLLVYTHKVTPRVKYIMQHILTGMLGIDLIFTAKVEEFVAHQGPRLTYSNKPLQSEFFIKCHSLLFEKGTAPPEIKIEKWEDAPCFFRTSTDNLLPFDIFAASFYLVTRYEEYQPHIKDPHGRYPYTQSLAFKYRFLRQPVVDLWVLKLRGLLHKRFPDLELKKNTPQKTLALIDIDISHRYRHRNILRTLGAAFRDLGRLKLKALGERWVVLFGAAPDPYDRFEYLRKTRKGNDPYFFFAVADYSLYSKNVSVYNPAFRKLIKHMADYKTVSLLVSPKATKTTANLVKEKKRLTEITNRSVSFYRAAYNRLVIPESYRQMSEAGFDNDFSMGYPGQAGFRAGTCTPFRFYDLAFEMLIPVTIHPFAFHYRQVKTMTNTKKIMQLIKELHDNTKEVEGKFTAVFNNKHFRKRRPHWLKIYTYFINEPE